MTIMPIQLSLPLALSMALSVVRGAFLAQPKSTSSVDSTAAVNDRQYPRPTEAPGITHELRSVLEAELFARSDLQTNPLTCGYISALSQSPVTCNTGFTCNYFTTPLTAPNFGCCTTGTGSLGCAYASTCLDYNAFGNVNTLGIVITPNDSGGALSWQVVASHHSS